MIVVCCSSRIVSGPGCLEAKMSFRRCCGGDDDGDFRYHCFGHLYPSQLRPSWDYQPIRICVAANGQTLWALTWRYRECYLQHFSDLELFHAFSASASVAVPVLLDFSVSFDNLPIFFEVEQWIEQIFGSFSRKVVSFEFAVGDRRWRIISGTHWHFRPYLLAPTWIRILILHQLLTVQLGYNEFKWTNKIYNTVWSKNGYFTTKKFMALTTSRFKQT